MRVHDAEVEHGVRERVHEEEQRRRERRACGEREDEPADDGRSRDQEPLVCETGGLFWY